ncbi:hypothetical protein JTB14_006080 [Gonioctena quinquepunctata]|nr:hypothetical protein JTB14_006080 [Gonioctena quinquepunctata]
MSEDELSDCFEEPNMEIQIKTLMGTTFDMKVSAMDTIADIKKKIYRIEGIPTFQQNLIYQSRDLKDFNRLVDAGISNGATLTLVISMKGGPISTRRLSVTCEHHVMLKELKELLENTREEITPGSKVSVLVFKEGDVINLLRVIENDDGSYSPYSEKPISPPSKPTRRGSRMGIFERLIEDNEMSTKLSNLRKKMEEVNSRKQGNSSKDVSDASLPKLDVSGEAAGFSNGKRNSLSFKFLEHCRNELLDNSDLKIFEKNSEEDNEEEIALKDKHRSKPHKHRQTKSLFSESKGACSYIKQNYARINKKSRDLQLREETSQVPSSRSELSAALAEKIGVFDEDTFTQSLPMPSANRIHLTRLVLSESSESPKSSSDGIELEENVQDLWEIHEPASERLKHSATCKVGVLKRRQSLDYTFDSIKNVPKGEIGNYPCENSDFEVCSSNMYHIPQFMSPSSALPPHHTQKEPSLHDYYFTKSERSPLYSRSDSESLSAINSKSEDITKDKFDILDSCSSIQRLQNESLECDNLFSLDEQGFDDLHGYCNLGCPSDLLGEKIANVSSNNEKQLELPPVIKKKARCNKCNRKLNITNIYNCRCGKIFCSQHRYSEVHRCSYDYKLEGRMFLEQQNPRVTAEKINKI